MDADFAQYKLVIAPMLYMVREGVGERLTRFVEDGGTLVATYWSGICDDSALCFETGFPGPLREALGIRSEEIDVLYEHESVPVVPSSKSGFTTAWTGRIFCDLIHAERAEVLATYDGQFYTGRPALTRNRHGKGTAWYVAFRGDDLFLNDLIDRLINETDLHPVLETTLPTGVTAQMRPNGERQIIFLMNFTNQPQTVILGPEAWRNIIGEKKPLKNVELNGYGFVVLEKETASVLPQPCSDAAGGGRNRVDRL
jgi:beta-galactosidase